MGELYTKRDENILLYVKCCLTLCYQFNQMEFQFKSLIALFDYFKDEKTCYEFLGQQIWDGVPTCPHCGSERVYITKTRSKSAAKKDVPEFKCAEKGCSKNFSATVGTIFESSKLPLRKWFGAIWLCTTTSKGISSANLAKQLEITQKTAWFVLSRIREMFKETNPDMLLGGTIEIDETFVGGKEKNKSKKIRAANKAAGNKTGNKRNVNPVDTKTPVLGILQRGGEIRITPMVAPNYEVLKPILQANISPEATIVTDGLPAYKKIGVNYKLHVVVNHAQDEWVKGEFSTNGIESFWATFKRGIIGVYHQTSVKHLGRYCDEYSYRYSVRDNASVEKFASAVKRVANARITYKALTGI